MAIHFHFHDNTMMSNISILNYLIFCDNNIIRSSSLVDEGQILTFFGSPHKSLQYFGFILAKVYIAKLNNSPSGISAQRVV